MRGGVADCVQVDESIHVRVDSVDLDPSHRTGGRPGERLGQCDLQLGRADAEGWDDRSGIEDALSAQTVMGRLARLGLHRQESLCPSRIIGEPERVGRAGVPDARTDGGVDVIVTEQDEIGLQFGVVDLDLIHVGILALDRVDERMREQHVDPVARTGTPGFAKGLDR